MSNSKGKIMFGTVGYTSNSSSSARKNYPIKQKFECISTNANVGTPPNSTFWQLYPPTANQKFWFPFSNTDFVVASVGYITYVDGAEFTYVEPKPKTDAQQVLPSYQRGAIGLWNPEASGIQSLVYANDIYHITDTTTAWFNTGLPDEKNPYKTLMIRVWRKLGDSLTSYWYQPTQKRFYPVNPTLAASQYRELASIGDTADDLYSKFTGEARELNMSNFTFRQIEELELKGFTRKEAEERIRSLQAEALRMQALADSYKNPGAPPPAPGAKKPPAKPGATGTSASAKQNESSQPDSGTSNRSVVATIKKSVNSRILALGDNKKAEMVQYYRAPNGDYSLTPDRFVFRYYPNNVSYTDIGSNWTEIERVNNTPFVDFRNFKLMKISFEFVVGDNTNLMTSCDDELKLLRQMATRPESVIFLGMDKMFTEQLIYPSWTGGSGVEFAVVDLQITSVQRVQQPPDGNSQSSPRGEIARATCNMTIQELPLEGPNLIVMPRIAQVNTPNIPTDTPEDTCAPLFWGGDFVDPKYRGKKNCNNEQQGK